MFGGWNPILSGIPGIRTYDIYVFWWCFFYITAYEEVPLHTSHSSARPNQLPFLRPAWLFLLFLAPTPPPRFEGLHRGPLQGIRDGLRVRGG